MRIFEDNPFNIPAIPDVSGHIKAGVRTLHETVPEYEARLAAEQAAELQGRVEDTIETFLKDNSGNKIIFSHMDMDNYNPTKYTLEKIKPFLTQGSIVLFDEFYGFQGWKNHEFKALQEVFKESEYNYIGFSKRQAVIKLN